MTLQTNGLGRSGSDAVPTVASARREEGAHKLLLGTFIHSQSLGELRYRHGAAVAVSREGKIAAVEEDCDRSRAEAELLPRLGWALDDVVVVAAKDGQFFFPGFIDTHLHASQYPNVGIFGKSTLLDWLHKYTFPMEASLADPARARRVYGRCVRKTLSHGTTCAAYYATVDVASTNLLADICLAAGQRALVGRVCMDSDLQPSWYRDEGWEAGLRATKECIGHVERVDPGFATVRPVITPRFAPSCSAEMMKALGELHAETGLPVQTHVSENAAEIELVKELFCGGFKRCDAAAEAEGKEDVLGSTYTGVYERYGLLTDKTILAHAVHLSEGEADLIAARGAKVSHCPCSNSSITSGAARVRWLLSRGVEVGLGTDMSGGYSPSVLEAARQALLVSRHVAMTGGGDAAKLSVEEVLHLATAGGARCVGLEGRVGAFEVGFDWDAQLVGLGGVGDDGEDEEGGEAEAGGNVDVFGWETWEDRVAKWLFNGDDRNTKMVWVRGRLVHQRK
ncbi:guanine deaminase [Gaeumannomyces tritici R3-111a-1]|uniref:Guanine deaminase n=1 Tax=Gaeumannomyces tritici (strain R3-111a-1) TaxID=644352 RepID=J3NP32_GAET3|nr:guanine deaminase [Gaeumannomyces tritici R3-111a-1]EJT77935.1 guanine deaminase [Gaeumannomyces tritici R3-111a-1]